MKNTLKLEKEFRRWNNFFIFFGLYISKPINGCLRFFPVTSLIVITIMSGLTYLQFSRTDQFISFFDEDGIVRFVHMLGNFLVIFQILLTIGEIKRCSKIQKRFQTLERYNHYNIGAMIRGYFLFPVINLTFFTAMDIAEYVFLQSEVSSIDVVPIISAHILILYSVLHVLSYSVHLSWLRRLNALLNFELCRITNEIRDRTRRKQPRNISKTLFVPSKSLQSMMSHGERPMETMDTVMEIKLCRYLYNESYELSKDINESYATRNLVVVFFNLVIGIIFLIPAVSDIIFLVTSKIGSQLTAEEITVESTVFNCRWSITCFITVYSLIWASRLTTLEMNQLSYWIYDMLSFRVNTKIKAELHRFAIQLQQSQVKFSGHEYFTLNNELFLSIVGTIMYYLVVMFQLNV